MNFREWIVRCRRVLGLATGRSSTGETGEWGERVAADFLARRGLRVVVRNWRNPADEREEIDLVCTDGPIVVFVEVKTRTPDALVPGYHAIDRRKKKVLLQACKAYLRGLRTKPHTFRFDVVEVSGQTGAKNPEVLHFENVELFSKHYRP